jgi:hypothetical protein
LVCCSTGWRALRRRAPASRRRSARCRMRDAPAALCAGLWRAGGAPRRRVPHAAVP